MKAAMRLGVEAEVVMAAMSDTKLPGVMASQAFTDSPVVVEFEKTKKESKLAAMGK